MTLFLLLNLIGTLFVSFKAFFPEKCCSLLLCKFYSYTIHTYEIKKYKEKLKIGSKASNSPVACCAGLLLDVFRLIFKERPQPFSKLNRKQQ